jgi:hypothetical protein
MSNDIDGLHHIGLVGRDLDRLAAQYERLGFALTPVSVPRFSLSPGGEPEPVGAGNRHAIFRDSYLELLGVLDRPLARYEGLHVLHLGASDLDAVRSRPEQSGLRRPPHTMMTFRGHDTKLQITHVRHERMAN